MQILYLWRSIEITAIDMSKMFSPQSVCNKLRLETSCCRKWSVLLPLKTYMKTTISPKRDVSKDPCSCLCWFFLESLRSYMIDKTILELFEEAKGAILWKLGSANSDNIADQILRSTNMSHQFSSCQASYQNSQCQEVPVMKLPSFHTIQTYHSFSGQLDPFWLCLGIHL